MKKLLPFLCFLIVLAASAEKRDAAQPNLVVIMTDDMGYADVGFNGCTDIPTPHIDSIAANGVTFSSGYVAYSVCGPSRAAFMTGRYGQRFGFERNPQYRPHDEGMGLPFTETTMAEALRGAGYHSGVVGKWHLGATKKHHPLNRGFDEFFGHLGGGHKYFPEALTIPDSYAAKDEGESYRTWILKNHTPVPPEGYLTDAFSDAAVDFVDRNHRKPFFLFLAYNAPHTPLEASEKYLSRFTGIQDKKRRTYAAMVSAVDDGVGRVLATLRKHGVEENTLVFFLSDNGGPTSKNASSNAPLRGNKGDPWEGGFRVPFAAQWPAGFPRGSTYEHPVISLDIFATIAKHSGAPATKHPLDGVDLTPYVNGDSKEPPHSGIFLRKFDQKLHAVRSGDHKLVVFENTDSRSLHDLRADIAEKNNILVQQPGVHRQLQAEYEAWNRPNIDPVFEGLSQSKAWKARMARAKAQKEKQAEKVEGKKDAAAWKDQYFTRFPDADADEDGALSWKEYKTHKAQRDALKK